MVVLQHFRRAAEQLDVSFLERIDRLLDLVAAPHIPVRQAVVPRDVEDVPDVVDEHADALDAVGQLDGDRRQLDTAWTVAALHRSLAGKGDPLDLDGPLNALEDRVERAGMVTPPAELSGALTGAVDRAAPVRLVRRFADEWQSDCRLEAKTADPRLLLAYSCITYPGQSGLPLVIALDREPEPVLIGVNIGRQSSWAGTKLDFTSVARPLDAEISATIERAAARAAHTVWRRRGSLRVTRRDDG